MRLAIWCHPRSGGERGLDPNPGPLRDPFWSLDGVRVDVPPGEEFGRVFWP